MRYNGSFSVLVIMKNLFLIPLFIVSIPLYADPANKVLCWGENNLGQLGNSTRDERNASWSPLEVRGLNSNTLEISGGVFHACSLLTNGKVMCWGSNKYGQLGNSLNSGNDKTNFAPLLVEGISQKVTKLAVGGYHTCVLVENGNVLCWGRNKYGQLGNKMYSGTETNINFPLSVNLSGKKAINISSGWGFSCAVLEDHSIKCWGTNKNGELGNDQNLGTDLPNPLPVDVQSLNHRPVDIASGENSSCTLSENRDVYCWGGADQTLSFKNDGAQNYKPFKVDTLSGKAKEIYLGSINACALLTNGLIECWGANSYAQLGSLDKNNHAPTINPHLNANTVSVMIGLAHICAIDEVGTIKCWGLNLGGELGVPTNYGKIDSNPYPLKVSLPNKKVVKGMRHSLSGFSCAIVE